MKVSNVYNILILFHLPVMVMGSGSILLVVGVPGITSSRRGTMVHRIWIEISMMGGNTASCSLVIGVPETSR